MHELFGSQADRSALSHQLRLRLYQVITRLHHFDQEGTVVLFVNFQSAFLLLNKLAFTNVEMAFLPRLLEQESHVHNRLKPTFGHRLVRSALHFKQDKLVPFDPLEPVRLDHEAQWPAQREYLPRQANAELRVFITGFHAEDFANQLCLFGKSVRLGGVNLRVDCIEDELGHEVEQVVFVCFVGVILAQGVCNVQVLHRGTAFLDQLDCLVQRLLSKRVPFEQNGFVHILWQLCQQFNQHQAQAEVPQGGWLRTILLQKLFTRVVWARRN